MKCSKCKGEVSDDSKFCPNCGSIVEIQGITCLNPECGRTGLPQDAVYCPDCRSKLMEVNDVSNVNIFSNNIDFEATNLSNKGLIEKDGLSKKKESDATFFEVLFGFLGMVFMVVVQVGLLGLVVWILNQIL